MPIAVSARSAASVSAKVHLSHPPWLLCHSCNFGQRRTLLALWKGWGRPWIPWRTLRAAGVEAEEVCACPCTFPGALCWVAGVSWKASVIGEISLC